MRRNAVAGQLDELAGLLAESHPRAVYRRLFGVAASLPGSSTGARSSAARP
jgi:hypothetical protein